MFQILDKVSHLCRKGERDRSTDNRGREKGGREEGRREEGGRREGGRKGGGRREEGGGRENGDTPPNGGTLTVLGHASQWRVVKTLTSFIAFIWMKFLSPHSTSCSEESQ